MKFTNAEKLIVTMLADLHEKLGIAEVDTKLIKQAIYSNNTWALSWGLPGFVGESPEPAPPEVSLVLDILDMWTFIEDAYESLNASGKSALEAKTELFGREVTFSGFDGNSESEHLSIASFSVKDMKRFTRFADRDLNSHRPMSDGYKRMLAKFLAIRPELGRRGLSAEELADVLNARRHSGL